MHRPECIELLWTNWYWQLYVLSSLCVTKDSDGMKTRLDVLFIVKYNSSQTECTQINSVRPLFFCILAARSAFLATTARHFVSYLNGMACNIACSSTTAQARGRITRQFYHFFSHSGKYFIFLLHFTLLGYECLQCQCTDFKDFRKQPK